MPEWIGGDNRISGDKRTRLQMWKSRRFDGWVGEDEFFQLWVQNCVWKTHRENCIHPIRPHRRIGLIGDFVQHAFFFYFDPKRPFLILWRQFLGVCSPVHKKGNVLKLTKIVSIPFGTVDGLMRFYNQDPIVPTSNSS